MAKLTVHNIKGEQTGEIELSDAVFGITDINQDLFYEVVKAQLASRRAGTHAAKTRSAVAGSKKKIYKQKGTGASRHGSKRAPQLYKGGVAHPPRSAVDGDTVPAAAAGDAGAPEDRGSDSVRAGAVGGRTAKRTLPEAA